jgi:hypothetical protein
MSPVPWIESPAMEEPGAEGAIIAAIESKSIRYVLWSWPGKPPESYTIFDEVPNRLRVPEIFGYVERCFPQTAIVEGCEVRFRDLAVSGPGSSSGRSATAPRPR